MRPGRRPAAALVFLALVGGVVGTTVGLVQADRSRTEAHVKTEQALAAERRAADELEQATRAREQAVREQQATVTLAGFLHYDILLQADLKAQAEWRQVVDPDLTLREVLDRAAARIDQRKQLTRRSEAMLRWAIGDAYVGLGQPAKGVPHLQRAWELLADEPEYGPAHPETLFGLHKLAVAHRAAGRPDLAFPLSQTALKRSLDWYAKDPHDILGPLAAMTDAGLGHLSAGQPALAVVQCLRAEEWSADKFGPNDGHTLNARFNLAESYRADGRLDPAVRHYRAVLDRIEDGDDPSAANGWAGLGQALLARDDAAGAESAFRDSSAIRRRREPKAWMTFHTTVLLGRALLEQRKYAEAERQLTGGYRGMKALEVTIPPRARDRLPTAADGLVELYAVWGRASKVEKVAFQGILVTDWHPSCLCQHPDLENLRKQGNFTPWKPWTFGASRTRRRRGGTSGCCTRSRWRHFRAGCRKRAFITEPSHFPL